MNLINELQSQRVSSMDLSGFAQVSKGTSLRTALDQLRTEQHSVCLVTDGGRLCGILTERDVLTKVMGAPNETNSRLDGPVDTVMTEAPVTIGPEASAATALTLMTDRHIRNLPVIGSDGALLGNMTHQAIIGYLAARYPVEVLNLPPDPDRFPRKQEGG